MKILCSESLQSYQYKGVTIYYDRSEGAWYVYTESKGRGRMDFESDRAAEEYIDSITSATILADDEDWPDSDEWGSIDLYSYDGAEAMESLWSNYLSEPEDAVYDKYNIFAEPSVQGYSGGMFLFDNNDENEPIEVSWMSWLAKECDLAAASSNAQEYQQKFDRYISKLLKEYGWAR